MIWLAIRRVGSVLLILGLGVFLLSQFILPKPEGTDRRVVIRQMLASGIGAKQGSVGLATAPDATLSVIVHTPVVPVLAEMSALAVDAPVYNSYFDLWRTRQLDWEAPESKLTESEMLALRQASVHLSPSSAIQKADPSAPTALMIQDSFEAIDYTECCAGSGSVPPDPELAVGDNHVIAATNVAYQIYSLDGTPLIAPRTFANLFSSVAGCNSADDVPPVRSNLFDPNVLYDEVADRFFVAIDRMRSNGVTGAVVNGSFYCVGVSATSDPMGQWYLYAFAMDGSDTGGVWMDYPSAGIGRDAIYMGGNMFSTGLPANIEFVESRVWAINKNEMYAGDATQIVERSSGEDFTPQPLNLHGASQGTWPTGGAHYFLTIRDFDTGGDHALLSWQNPFSTPTPALNLVSVVDLNSATGTNAGMPVNSPQQNGNPLQGNDYRPLDFEYRNGYGWTTATVACNPGSGTVNCIRWAQILLSNGTVNNAGIYASNSTYRTFPDLAVNHCGDMAVGYSKMSSSSFPATWVNGRESSTPAGQLQSEIQLKAGEIAYEAFDSSPHRWGDYTGMAIAPDGLTFWYLGEYSKDTETSQGRWGTYIGSFRYPNCVIGAPGDEQNFLPILRRIPATPTPTPPPPPEGPEPGYWLSTNFAHEFYVSSDRQNVQDFTTYFSVNGCGDYYVAQSAGIANDQFSFTGDYYASGTFSNTTSASGTAGLDHLYIAGCGYVSGGPWNWTAYWESPTEQVTFLLANLVAADDGQGATPPYLTIIHLGGQ